MIFSKSGKITERDDKTNIKLNFSVPQDIKRLDVKYSYFPKDIENTELARQILSKELQKYDFDVDDVTEFMPVHNLVTLSFDENSKYRGACHRQPNVQNIIIADENSTAGIINRPITAGEWDVVLNVHYAGCDIDYNIEINGERK